MTRGYFANRTRFIITLLLMAVAAAGQAADERIGEAETGVDIAPFFAPPAGLPLDVDRYKSPLVFDDGRPVTTPDEWRQRRQELLRFWHQALGPWPPLLERPRIEVLESVERAGFTQNRVRLPAAPDLNIEGYLLVPQGDGPHPAVLVVYYGHRV